MAESPENVRSARSMPDARLQAPGEPLGRFCLLAVKKRCAFYSEASRPLTTATCSSRGMCAQSIEVEACLGDTEEESNGQFRR